MNDLIGSSGPAAALCLKKDCGTNDKKRRIKAREEKIYPSLSAYYFKPQAGERTVVLLFR